MPLCMTKRPSILKKLVRRIFAFLNLTLLFLYQPVRMTIFCLMIIPSQSENDDDYKTKC